MYFRLKIESSSLEEDTASYIAEVFNAKITWIPFMHKLPKDDPDFDSRAFNYSKMTVSYGWITNKTGYTQEISYAFSDSSL
jgi:hypothetical protein